MEMKKRLAATVLVVLAGLVTAVVVPSGAAMAEEVHCC